MLFGQASSVVGLQAVIGLVVFSQFSFTPEQAALNALWAPCGAVVQIVLVPLTWPLQRFPVERAASSTAYRRLADHLRSLVADPSALFETGALDELRSALMETQPWSDQAAAAAYQAMADEAERIRLQAAAVARTRARLTGTASFDTPTSTQSWAHDAARSLDAAIEASANVLSEVAGALHDARSVAVTPDDRERFRAAVEHLRALGHSADRQNRVTPAQAVDDLTALAGQLRSVAQLTAVAAGDQPPRPRPPPCPRTPLTPPLEASRGSSRDLPPSPARGGICWPTPIEMT